jgi:LPXTG-motif cell wall-anchored protein
VVAGDQGSLGPVTLKFGGQVPDGTYQVVVSTPGPGQRETVTDDFTIEGCGPALPFTGSRTPALLVIGFGLLVAGALLLRRVQPSEQESRP